MIELEDLLQLPVTQVPIDTLLPAHSPRLRGEDLQHVQRLADLEDRLPPIIVNRTTMRVIDGMHRLSASKIRGEQVIDVRFFDGDETSAFVLAVRTNITHGLPLSLSDRKSAAERIIRSYPHWSDRTIALVSGLAPKTVAQLRKRPDAQECQLDARIGRDGRFRPVNGAERRALAAELMRQEPAASLRSVARRAGISPETARKIRAELAAPDLADPEVVIAAVMPPVRMNSRRAKAVNGSYQASSLGHLVQLMSADPAIRLNETGRVTLRALTASGMLQSQSAHLAEALPAHALENIALAARACANIWQQFWRQVEQRRTGRPDADDGPFKIGMEL